MAFIQFNVNPDFSRLCDLLERIAVALESVTAPNIQGLDTEVHVEAIDDYEMESERDESEGLLDPEEKA